MNCPCTSGQSFAECCEPIIQQQQQAKTAEQLMRSRYSAYALGHIDWIIDSQSPDGRAHVDRKATEEWSKRADWHRMEIVEVQQGTESDTEGFAHRTFNQRLGPPEPHHATIPPP